MDPHSEQGDWSHRHLLTCILEGLRWTRKKPMNYAILHLKDKFIIQSASDIRRKLQKLALGREQSLQSLLNLATSMFYNKEQEEQAEKNRQDQRKAAALVLASGKQTQGAGKTETLGLATSLAELAIKLTGTL
ncbi:hypothetical protein AAY473_034533 [Plecturocebus cupreus]